MLDRWVAVTPSSENAASQVRRWVVNEGWNTTFDDMFNDDSSERKPLPFTPFILRNRSQYTGRELARSTMTGGKHDGCEYTYSVQCVKAMWSVTSEWSVLKTTRCGQRTTEKTLRFTPVSTSMTVCTAEEQAISDWGWFNQDAWHRKAFAVDNSGQLDEMPKGECVQIAALDPSSGIDLDDLDGDLMGSGTDDLANNATKMQHIKKFAENAGRDFVKGILDTAGQVIEGGVDVVKVVNASIDNDTDASNMTGNLTVKWVKRLSLATMVDMCLCCNTDVVETNETMAAHCKSAYTLGGQNKTNKWAYYGKATAGTLYNLAKTIGSVLVPFVGGSLVGEGHEKVCQYTCGLRKPLLYEPYEFGKVRQVPGMALKTWLAGVVAD
jgi:hypothetical protein